MRWLENGAHLYVCGDADAAWRPTCTRRCSTSSREHGGRSRDDADAYVRRLADERRYLRDVY